MPQARHLNFNIKRYSLARPSFGREFITNKFKSQAKNEAKFYLFNIKARSIRNYILFEFKNINKKFINMI
jgi:hypothetical protein